MVDPLGYSDRARHSTQVSELVEEEPEAESESEMWSSSPLSLSGTMPRRGEGLYASTLESGSESESPGLPRPDGPERKWPTASLQSGSDQEMEHEIEEALEETVLSEEDSQDERELMKLLGAYEASGITSSPSSSPLPGGSLSLGSPLCSRQHCLEKASTVGLRERTTAISCAPGGYWRMRMDALIVDYRRRRSEGQLAREGQAAASTTVGSPAACRGTVACPSWFVPSVPVKPAWQRSKALTNLRGLDKSGFGAYVDDSDDLFEDSEVDSPILASSPDSEEALFQRMSPTSLRREINAFHAGQAGEV